MTSSIIIFTLTRCGGGLLQTSLDNHPGVRAEPSTIYWRKLIFDDASKLLPNVGHVDRHNLYYAMLYGLLHRPEVVSVLKVVYDPRTMLPPSIWGSVDKLILLNRDNLLRTSISAIAKRREREKIKKPFAVEVNEFEDFVNRRVRLVESYLREVNTIIDRFELPVLSLNYIDMVYREGNTIKKLSEEISHKICDFLGVSRRILVPRHLSRSNPEPLRNIISNWPEIEQMIKDNGWGKWLVDEGFYDVL